MLAEVKEESLSYHQKLSDTEGHSKNVEGDRELLRTQIVDLRKVGRYTALWREK